MGIFDRLFGVAKTQPARKSQSAPPTDRIFDAKDLYSDLQTSARPPQPQSKSDLKAVQEHLDACYARRDPRFSCHKPLHLLQGVFIFASGDAGGLSYLTAALLQEAADSTIDKICKQAPRQYTMSNSTVCAECRQTGKVPDSALKAMSHFEPALIARFLNNEVELHVRPFDGLPTGQTAAIFLFYNKA